MAAETELQSERLAAAVLDHGQFVNRILPGGPNSPSLNPPSRTWIQHRTLCRGCFLRFTEDKAPPSYHTSEEDHPKDL